MIFLPVVPLALTLVSSSPASRVDGDTRIVLPTTSAARVATLGVQLRAAARARGVTVDPAVSLELESRRGLGGKRPEIITVNGRLGGHRLTRPVARMLVDAGGVTRLVTWHGDVPASRGFARVLDEDDAVAAVAALGGPGSQGATSAELRVDPRATHSVLVWRVDPPLDRAAMSNRVFHVDAGTGEVRVVMEKVQSAEINAYYHNPITHPVANAEPVNEIDPEALHLEGARVVARNCIAEDPAMACNPAPKATADTVGNFIYPTPDLSDPAEANAPEDEFSEASVYYHADKFDAWLQSFGQPGVPCQAQGEPLVIVANLRGENDSPIDNAFYTGDCAFTIGMGQGVVADYGYDGDVVYHEVGHGVTFQQVGESGLFGRDLRPEAVVNDGGGLSEGLADFWSSSFTGDPVVGDFTIARNNANDFTCPADMPGQSHADSEVWAGALWSLYAEHGEQVVGVVLDGVAMFPAEPTYEDAAEAVVATAFVEVGEVLAAQIEEEFTVRNLTSCERYAPVEDVDNGQWLLPASWGDEFNPMRPPPFQFEITAPPGATMAHLTFELGLPFPGAVLDGLVYDVNGLWNVAEPVEFIYDVSPGGIVSVEAEPTSVHYDLAPDGVHASLDVPVEGGEVYYLALFNLEIDVIVADEFDLQFDIEPVGGSTGQPPGDSSGDGQVDSSGSATTAPPMMTSTTGEVDTDTDPGASSSDGDCACRTREDRPGLGSAAWLLALVIARRRRR